MQAATATNEARFMKERVCFPAGPRNNAKALLAEVRDQRRGGGAGAVARDPGEARVEFFAPDFAADPRKYEPIRVEEGRIGDGISHVQFVQIVQSGAGPDGE